MQNLRLKVALVPFHEYEELLKRSQFAPKILPPLTGKQKRRVNDALEAAAVCHFTDTTMADQPREVQELIAEKTLRK